MTEWHNWREVKAAAIARGQINEDDMAAQRREYEEQLRTYQDRSPVMTLGGAIVLLVIGLLLFFLTVGALHVVGLVLAIAGVVGLVVVLVGANRTRL